jgi:polysaccharide biosynthesis/export protein
MSTGRQLKHGPFGKWERMKNRVAAAVVIMVVLVACTLAPQPTGAQPPTPEQLRMLQQLPESQRQEFLRSMGITDTARIEADLEFPETVRAPDQDKETIEPLPRLMPGSTVIVKLDLREDGLEAEAKRRYEEHFRLNPRVGALRGAATYELDGEGRVQFPGVVTIPLGGLSEKDAALRIQAEPKLRFFRAEVRLLSLERTGADALEPFGYSLFRGAPMTFAPATDVPVPPDYVIGPGDRVGIQLYGNESSTHSLVVSRDGSLDFPRIGPIVVAGLSFQEMRELIQQRVSEQMIGISASITMGELRSIRVFVLGDATRPGSFTVSGLSTMTNALFASGGVNERGSLRNVQLRRDGELIVTLDLYDLLLKGDTRADARLMPGDVIFVPPVGAQVGVDGEVRRPGIYELRGPATAAELLALAGGLTATAYPQGTILSRIDDSQRRVVEDLDLRSRDGQVRHVRGGDLLTVPRVVDRVDNAVTLMGHVYRPRTIEYRPGMRLSDLLPSLAELKPLADTRYVLVRREMPPDRKVVALSVDLVAALEGRGEPADLVLMSRDEVTVFDLAQGRSETIVPLLEVLRLQATLDATSPVVRVGGRVRAPGEYPLEPDMRVSDLMRAGGSLSESAYVIDAELTRYEVIDGTYRQTALIRVDLAAIRAGNQDADLVLRPFDFLNVKEVSFWREQYTVTLRGEVRFPGTYPIRNGETLLSVIGRAGGLTDEAYPGGAVFTREMLRDREREQIERLARQMEQDLATLALSGAQAGPGAPSPSETITAGRMLLEELRTAEPVGRLAMDLPRMLRSEQGGSGDLVLKDGDMLSIPGAMQSVTVIGQVQSPTSHIHDSGLSREDYVMLSGGYAQRADRSRVYIIRANGQVAAAGSNRWFRNERMEVMPGDTIVVPMDVERMRPIPLWTAVTQILFNVAVAVAAVNSF